MERLAESILLTTNELSEGAPVSAKMFPASWNPLGSRSVSLSLLAWWANSCGQDGAFTCPRSKAGLEPIHPWRSVWSKGLRCSVARPSPRPVLRRRTLWGSRLKSPSALSIGHPAAAGS
jgi:hypothetical protein